MKQKLVLAMLTVVCGLLTSCKPKISGQIAADWQMDTNFRVVDGELYDSIHSELWDNPVELAGFRSHSNPENFRLLTYFAKVETVDEDKIQCGIYEQAHWPPVASGDVESEDLVQEIVIYHYPNAESLVSGQDLGDCRGMRVANYISGGVSLIALDCGVPYPTPVPWFNGVRVKINNVRVCLVEAKEVNDFMQKKESDAGQQCSQIKSNVDKLQSEVAALRFETVDASYFLANDPPYISLLNESRDDKKKIETLYNAVAVLRSKYGEQPWKMDIPLIRRYPKDYLNAWHAEDVDDARISSIQVDVKNVDNEISSLTANVAEEEKERIQILTDQLNEANESLKSFQTANYFLADYSPAALEVSLTDEKGRFVIHNPMPDTKIFATVKPDNGETNEDFFWLVDLPATGEKLILSNNNMFTVPANPP